MKNKWKFYKHILRKNTLLGLVIRIGLGSWRQNNYFPPPRSENNPMHSLFCRETTERPQRWNQCPREIKLPGCSLITLINCRKNIRPTKVHQDKEELSIGSDFHVSPRTVTNCHLLGLDCRLYRPKENWGINLRFQSN